MQRIENNAQKLIAAIKAAPKEQWNGILFRKLREHIPTKTADDSTLLLICKHSQTHILSHDKSTNNLNLVDHDGCIGAITGHVLVALEYILQFLLSLNSTEEISSVVSLLELLKQQLLSQGIISYRGHSDIHAWYSAGVIGEKGICPVDTIFRKQPHSHAYIIAAGMLLRTAKDSMTAKGSMIENNWNGYWGKNLDAINLLIDEIEQRHLNYSTNAAALNPSSDFWKDPCGLGDHSRYEFCSQILTKFLAAALHIEHLLEHRQESQGELTFSDCSIFDDLPELLKFLQLVLPVEAIHAVAKYEEGKTPKLTLHETPPEQVDLRPNCQELLGTMQQGLRKVREFLSMSKQPPPVLRRLITCNMAGLWEEWRARHCIEAPTKEIEQQQKDTLTKLIQTTFNDPVDIGRLHGAMPVDLLGELVLRERDKPEPQEHLPATKKGAIVEQLPPTVPSEGPGCFAPQPNNGGIVPKQKPPVSMK